MFQENHQPDHSSPSSPSLGAELLPEGLPQGQDRGRLRPRAFAQHEGAAAPQPRALRQIGQVLHRHGLVALPYWAHQVAGNVVKNMGKIMENAKIPEEIR